MNKNALISIIIPIYNVEIYLRKCIDSVINQTYKNLEIILVDDGSTDNSGKICDEYLTKDTRIKVIHKVNGGLSDARNAGLDVFNGDYVYFLDSDDFIHSKTIENMYNILIKNDCDIVGSINCIYYDFNMIEDVNLEEGNLVFFNKIDALKKCNENILITAPYKLYKRYIFDKIRFMKGIIYEDAQIAPYIYDQINKIAITYTPYYYRYVRKDSISQGNYSDKVFDLLKVSEDRIRFFKSKNYDFLYQKSYCFLLGNIVLMYRRAYESKVSKNIKKKIKKLYYINYKKYHKELNLSQKIKYLSFLILPNLMVRLSKLKKV